ncbi:unnamed protein product [Amoebophrya sp. A120]|nr:unnamed protein product [Amoebophrya sp. A120]|eukprot:GSA120T00014162001.1
MAELNNKIEEGDDLPSPSKTKLVQDADNVQPMELEGHKEDDDNSNEDEDSGNHPKQWTGDINSEEYKERQRLIAQERMNHFERVSEKWKGKGPKAKNPKAPKPKMQEVEILPLPRDGGDTLLPIHLKRNVMFHLAAWQKVLPIFFCMAELFFEMNLSFVSPGRRICYEEDVCSCTVNWSILLISFLPTRAFPICTITMD